MARTTITQEMIIQMNEYYLEYGTYAAVSRAMGGTPCASTVKRYIIDGYVSKKVTEENRQVFSEERLNELDNVDDSFWDKFCCEDWGELCELSEEEMTELEVLWQELTI